MFCGFAIALTTIVYIFFTFATVALKKMHRKFLCKTDKNVYSKKFRKIFAMLGSYGIMSTDIIPARKGIKIPKLRQQLRYNVDRHYTRPKGHQDTEIASAIKV